MFYYFYGGAGRLGGILRVPHINAQTHCVNIYVYRPVGFVTVVCCHRQHGKIKDLGRIFPYIHKPGTIKNPPLENTFLVRQKKELFLIQ